VSIRHLELTDFRIFSAAALDLQADGTTVITGENGTGKTSVLEAIVYLSTRRSFRGAPTEALVRTGTTEAAPTSAFVRAEVSRGSAPTLVDAEIALAGRSRVRVNRKPVSARKDMAAAIPSTIFSPEDLAIVGGAPKGRRDLLDDALALLDPEGARAADETDRVLRQRAALLRQSGGRINEDVATTLDVWDQRLADAGKVLVAARERLVADLEPLVAGSYNRLAGADGAAPALVQQSYQRSWSGELLDALAASRTDDLRRGVNTVGPHRDELLLVLEGREARSHASQGEQRCLALALRLGIHELVRTKTELRPTLLLDDVFSELDPVRSRALVAELPTGQSLLTTAAPLPEGIDVAAVIQVGDLVR
jgi:DNA replication and repair protein RecF